MRPVALSLLLLATAACSIESAPTVAPDGTVDVPNDESGLRAKVPDNAKPNGFGGMAGFHSDDDTISVRIQEKADADFETAKADAEALLFKSWIKSEATADGYVLQYTAVGMDMEGNEYDNYVYEVARKIGDTTYTCSGSVKDQAHLAANIAICDSLKK